MGAARASENPVLQAGFFAFPGVEASVLQVASSQKTSALRNFACLFTFRPSNRLI